eukprot:385554_1
MSQSKIPFFYHGISRSMLLDSTSLKLCGPVSTTSQYTVAVSRFAEKGIVLQIRNNALTLRFWPCSYWSGYCDEYEYLFIGGLRYFDVLTIRDIPNEQRYDPLIRAMTVFHYFVDGYVLDDRIVTQKNVHVIRSLIKEEKNHTLLKGLDSKVPVYFLSLFHHFLNTLSYMDMDLYLMDKEEHSTNRFGFKLLVSIFCFNEDPYSLNYALFLSLMPNVKSVIVWNYATYEQSVELNKEFVSSITEAMSLETQCQAFYIVNPSIPGSASLTDFINKEQETFNKFGWKLQQDTTFKHPRRRTYDVCPNTLSIKRL